ncbi:MAG: hypothetical protein HYX72_14635 [Acidobacteria bacterium]|nr:hypothetical protein [Acidobacteriota bacterium]
MAYSTARFCIDRNIVRWTLINGVINRKTNQDDPTGGQDISVQEVRAIERTAVRKKERGTLGRPLLFIAVLLLATAWGSDSLTLRFVVGLAGLALLYTAVERLRTKVTMHDAFRLVIPGRNAEEWTVVGVTPETMGFVRGVEEEISSPTRAAGA